MVPEKINFNFFKAAIPETGTTEDPKSEIRVSPNAGKVSMIRGRPHPVFLVLNTIEQTIIRVPLFQFFGWLKTPGHGFFVIYLILGCGRRGSSWDLRVCYAGASVWISRTKLNTYNSE